MANVPLLLIQAGELLLQEWEKALAKSQPLQKWDEWQDCS